jgi:hypothetical protein
VKTSVCLPLRLHISLNLFYDISSFKISAKFNVTLESVIYLHTFMWNHVCLFLCSFVCIEDCKYGEISNFYTLLETFSVIVNV